MATFRALNIESDDEEDIEIDDTKEIQIEEALKLYQTALKLHSEGPASFDEAAIAYRALFDSEIFKYPESQTELKRQDLSDVSPEQDDWQLQDEGVRLVDYAGTSENAPSTLPQIIHLSCKNYGEFLLESLQYKLQHAAAEDVAANQQWISKASVGALNAFVDAIDKDDSDLDLWRRTSAVGTLLGSNRIARFCLEAVLDGDYSGVESVLAIPGLAESLAGQELRVLVIRMQDELSLAQGPLMRGKRRQLSKLLKQRLGTYETAQAYHRKHPQSSDTGSWRSSTRSLLYPPLSWTDLGDMLYRHMIGEQHGVVLSRPGSAISFALESEAVDMTRMEIDMVSPVDDDPPQPSELSSLVKDQFPGMDNGHPNPPPPAFFEPSKERSPPTTVDVSAGNATALPTRKRSGDAAGLQDVEDSGRVKSKRIRARESLVDQSQIEDASTVDLTQAEYVLADLDYYDSQMLQTINGLLGKLDIPQMNFPDGFRKNLRLSLPVRDGTMDGIERASLDLYAVFASYSDSLATTLLLKGGDLDVSLTEQAKPNRRFASGTGVQSDSQSRPELDPTQGLREFMTLVNAGWMHIYDVILLWVSTLLTPGIPMLGPELPNRRSSYTGHQWSEQFKTILVRILVALDDYIYQELSHRLECSEKETLRDQAIEGAADLAENHSGQVEMIVTLFELHLDVYSLIKEPDSGVDADTVTIQGDRTDRWANLARDAMNMRSNLSAPQTLKEELNLRYLWSATHHVSISSDISQEHIIACWQELRSVFIELGEPVIELQNNAVMPQLCIEAIDRELSRLTTHEFFDKVFDPAQTDLTVVIESLEPLLETLHRSRDGNDAGHTHLSSSTGTLTSDDAHIDAPAEYSATTSPELLNFLNNSSITERVKLWQRLREAYEAIDYQPMVVCCYFRTIELVVAELKTSVTHEQTLSERQTTLLKFLRMLHDLVGSIMQVLSSYTDALNCMEMERLQTGITALIDLLRLLHSFTMYQDDIHQGLLPTPMGKNGLVLSSFPVVTDLLQDLQLQTWTLMYKLFKEGVAQNKARFESSPEDSLFVFLRSVHQSLGARGICGKSNRVFIRMLKQELVQIRSAAPTNSEYDSEFAQALYDLYGLQCFVNPASQQQEHRCQHDAFVDRTSAMQAVDLLLTLAAKMKMSDLPKHPLKDTIEKVHGLATRKKPSEAILRNRDIYRAFLKSPINPLDLYRSLRGEGQLNLSPVPAEHAILAAKGWYFLMGQIALSKFRSQKRTGPTATEDLDIAVAFFMQDLEYSMDNWETWFRLAQAYDSKIEELVSWSAEKFNSNIAEVTQQQRAAIHCYIMAVTLATRSAKPGHETSMKLAELYADFAMRLYTSTRDPFTMQAFSVEEIDKFFSLDTVKKGRPFRAVTPYLAWKFARELFRRAIRITPDKWILHHYLGKCLWKMHSRGKDSPAISGSPPSVDDVITEIQKSIKLLPGKRDSKREPILEPHYKLVSVVHKMVMQQEINVIEACDILASTPHAAKIDPVSDPSEWEGYILKVLKNLRTADKQHWHHRMIARAAQIVYHDGTDDSHAIAAKNELTQQMFTKTMVLQVWRPEHERPGRHFVYTTRYTRFFVRLLDQLNDRAGLEALARRVRRKPTEFFEHSSVWNDICLAYLRVLRAHGSVPLGHETAIFSGISHEDFLRRKDILEKWCQDPSTEHPTLETLQDAIELKKVNSGLMKPGIIDDLIGDAYAFLYDTIGRSLWRKQEAEEAEMRRGEEEESAATKAALLTVAAPVPAPERNPMMNLSHLMNIDGAFDKPPSYVEAQPTPTPATDQTPGGGTMTPTESAPAPRRKIGVGRREIRLCAEACVARAAATAAASTPGSALRRGSADKDQNGTRDRSKSEVQVIIQTRRPAKTDTPEGGSIDDDADDESELSDVDEDVVAQGMSVRPLFPGLMKASAETELEEDDDDDDGVGEDDHEDDKEDHHDDAAADGVQDVTMADEDEGGEEEADEEDEDDDPGEGAAVVA
ncbi:hypothetical protein MBLNU459_g7611t1 [Dothideomycetes sp. NU459]